MKPFAAPATPRNSRRRARLGLAVCTAMATVVWTPIIAVTGSPGVAAAVQSASSYQSPGTPDPSVAGATTPFATYQAPEGALGGGASVVSITSPPTSEYDSPQGEATGHAYVQLTGTGQYVQWTNNTGQPINFINVRASIPDSSSGGGITATLDLYVNGTFRQALNMNSIQSWQYEGNGNYQSSGVDQNAADGDPRNFWDEFHTFISGAAIAPGSTFSLRRDSSNTASFYWVNSVDVWDAPGPAPQPANSISITSCGATADNTPTNGAAAPGATDSTAAIQNCVNQAASQGKSVWIPQGTFYVIGTRSIVLNGVTVQGAGYLYSEVYRDIALPNSAGLGSLFQCYSCHLENFHIDTDALSRVGVDGGAGAEDTTGANWGISGMWVQHVESSVWASGSGGTVENNFFTDIWADGCNLNNVALTGTSGSNLTATNNFIRGTGDDGMAINSVAYNGSQTYTAMTNITMTHNTVLAAWGGKDIGVYGGSGHHVEDNYLADTARYIGLGVGKFGVNGSDMTGATVSGNVIVRGGGNAFYQNQPALMIGNGGDGQSTGTVTNATVTDNTIIDAVYNAVTFSTSTNTDLADNTIVDPWMNGIVISTQYYPAPSGNATITGNSVSGVRSGYAAYVNNSSGFTASLSNNSWQNTATEGPFGGTAVAVPGTVEAANYDTGGQGVAYNVTSANGSANSYRPDGVNLEATSDTQTTTGTGAGYDLGWTGQGQWFRYTIDVASAGAYTVSLRLASPNGVSDALHIADSSGTNLSGTVGVPATGGWQNWTTVTAGVTLPAGQHTLTVYQDNGGWNIHYLSFTGAEGPFAGTAAAVPGAVQAENYDTGGPGVAYDVNSTNGSANSYRADGVDLEPTSDTGGGYDLGWTGAGQWFRYTVDVASAGTYTVSFRLAAPSAVTDAFHVSNSSGQNLSGAVGAPATGGFQNWTTATANVTLPAGLQTLTLAQDNGGWNVNAMSFAANGGTGISPSGWYEVVNQNSNSCVDDTASGTANGTFVQQWSCGGSANQQWQFQPASGGYYSVLNRNAAAQNEVWDVTGGPSATASGVPIQTWSYGGGTNQQWLPVSVGSGYYKFVALNSGLCLDVPGASTANGVQLQQDTCNGTPAQSFRLVQQS